MTRTSLGALGLFAAAFLLVGPALSQRGGSNAPGRTANLYYSGHVAFEDGSVPKDKVIIESVCSGRVRQETNVDSRGGFGFTLGGSSGDTMLDASNTATRAGTGADSGNVAECVVRASMPGYSSDIVYLVNIERNKPDLGTIILRKAAPASAPAPASVTSAKAPKDARKAFEKAVEAIKNNKADEAQKQLQKAVETYPAYAEAWYLLARLQSTTKQADAARKSLEASMKADEKYIPPALDLARLEYNAQNWKGVTEITSRILKNAADLPASAGAIAEIPQSYQLHAVASARLGDAAAAEKSLRDGQKADMLHKVPKLWQMLGLVLADRGEFTAASQNLRQYLEYAPMASDAAKTRELLAEFEKRAAAAQAK